MLSAHSRANFKLVLVDRHCDGRPLYRFAVLDSRRSPGVFAGAGSKPNPFARATATGASLATTSQVAEQVESIIKSIPEVEGYLMSIGGGGGTSNVNQLFMPITLKPREDRKINHLAVMDQIRAGLKPIKNLRASLRDTSSRGLTTGRQFPISLNIMGPDLNVLDEKGKEIMKRLTDEDWRKTWIQTSARVFPKWKLNLCAIDLRQEA